MTDQLNRRALLRRCLVAGAVIGVAALTGADAVQARTRRTTSSGDGTNASDNGEGVTGIDGSGTSSSGKRGSNAGKNKKGSNTSTKTKRGSSSSSSAKP
jgi:hypothetical protein